MKINKRFFVGMAVLVFLFGYVLAACTTTKYIYVEDEYTQAIFEAASTLVSSKAGGITAGDLIEGLSNKISGLKAAPMFAINIDLINVVYQDKNYVIRCTIGSGESVGGTGGAASTVGTSTIVTSISSVNTRIEDPNQNAQ